MVKLGPAALGICLLGPAEGDGDPNAAFSAPVQALAAEPVAPGGNGELSLLVTEPVEAEVPIQVWLSSDALKLKENRLGWRDVVDPQAAQLRIRGSFVAPKEPGEYEVRAEVVYVSCSGRWCRSRHAAVGWTVTVKAPG